MRTMPILCRWIALLALLSFAGCSLVEKHSQPHASNSTPNNPTQSISANVSPAISGEYTITFQGTITDVYGNGLTNITVSAVIGDTGPFSGTTDANGNYNFTATGLNPYDSTNINLCATSQDNSYAPNCAQLNFDGSKSSYSQDFFLERTPWSISGYDWTFQGKVYDTNHQAISGAKVSLQIGNATPTLVTATGSGYYSISAQGNSSNAYEEATLCASATNYAQHCFGIMMTGSSATVTQYFALGTNSGTGIGNYYWTFKGTVEDTNYNLLDSAKVTVTANGNSTYDYTDSFGQYQITVNGFTTQSSLVVEICGQDAGYAEDCVHTTLTAPTDTITEDLALGPQQVGIGNYTWTFQGQIKDTAGYGIAGAGFSVQVGNYTPQSVQADNNGNYQLTITGFTSNTSQAVSLCATANNYKQSCVQSTLANAQDTVTEDFALSAIQVGIGNYQWTFQGHVVNPDDTALSQAKVTATAQDGNSAYAYTDASGNYAVTLNGNTTLKTEPVSLCAQAQNYQQNCISVTLGQAMDSITKDLSLAFSGLGNVQWNFSGKVTDKSQSPLSSAYVTIAAQDGTILASAYTDASGNYSTVFDGVDVNAEDSITICAQENLYYSSCVTKTVNTANASFPLNFSLAPEIIGNFSWDFTGNIQKTLGGPATGAVVTVTLQSSGKTGSVTVDSSGNYSLILTGTDPVYSDVANICAGGPTYEQQCFQQTSSDSNATFQQDFNLVYLDPKGGAYISAIYQDLFNRKASQGEVDYWVSVLKTQGAYSTALELVESDEHRKYVIEGYYQTFLNRTPDDQGLSYWVTQVQQGMEIEEISVRFVSSDEYFNDNGGTNTSFVQSLYKRFLNREADSQGLGFWVNQLSTGMSRADVARGFVTSDEYRSNLIRGWYQLLFHRAADPGGLQYWTDTLRSGHETVETVEAAMIASPEYHAALP